MPVLGWKPKVASLGFGGFWFRPKVGYLGYGVQGFEPNGGGYFGLITHATTIVQGACFSLFVDYAFSP